VEGATDNTLQPIAEVAENGSDSSSFQEAASDQAQQPQEATQPAPAEPLNEKFVSVYPYNSEEPGDLVFEAGELITVIAKNGDWWTGVIGDRNGVFPFNYVEAAPEAAPEAGEVPAVGEDAPEGAGEEAAASADTSLQVEDKSGKKLELATVIAPYEGTSKEQLTLAKGQMIIIKKRSAFFILDFVTHTI